MSIESKIKELLERATPQPAVQDPILKQGSSDIDHKGQADVEVLGSEMSGVASSANAGGAAPTPGSNQGGEKGVVMQGSSKVRDDEEEDLSGDGDANRPGVAASAKAGAAAPLPGSKSGGEMAPVLQGSSKEPTPGQMESDDSWKDELAAVFTEAGLSESSQEAVIAIFEKAVTSRVEAEIEAASDSLAEAVNELADSRNENLYEAVNEFLNYAVEQWMEANEVAIEKGLRAELAESFINNLKQVFVEHYIDVPAEKYDALQASNARIEELESQLNDSMSKTAKLAEEKRALERKQIVERAAADMVATDKEKFGKLVEDVDFDTAESFAEKVGALKDRYFPKGGASKPHLQETASESVFNGDSVSLVESAVKAISKSVKR